VNRFYSFQKRMTNTMFVRIQTLVTSSVADGDILYFFWCMKVSMESSSAYIKLVWWMGDLTPVYLEAKLLSL